MKDIIILIGVTFRDFDASVNDYIQRLFLESIKHQTYTNWKLVVTIFNELNVRPVINNYNMNTVFYLEGPVADYKYSLTDVLLNTITESNKEDKSVIIWTTCDIILEPDFFQNIIDIYTDNLFAISHPHSLYASIDDLGTDKYITKSINTGIDLIIMGSGIFKSDKNLNIIRNYKYYDWGVFEHFLVGVSQLNDGEKINLYGITNISKIINDRRVNNETDGWLLKCKRKNKTVLDAFIGDYKLSKSLSNLTYCHMQFRILSNKYLHFVNFRRDYFKYYFKTIKSTITPYLPVYLKNIIKKKVKP